MWKTREPLNMFLATFDSNEDVKKMYEINLILHSVVLIDPVQNSRLIPQCKNCPVFGHAKTFCGKISNCVKCSDRVAKTNFRNTKILQLWRKLFGKLQSILYRRVSSLFLGGLKSNSKLMNPKKTKLTQTLRCYINKKTQYRSLQPFR